MKPYAELTYQGQARRIRQIAREVIRRQDLCADRLELIFHGENTTFRARNSDGADYLIRVHRPGYQTRRTIVSELEFLAALRRETELLVPTPVGEGHQAVSRITVPGVEPRDAVAFEWIPGRFSSRFTVTGMRRVGDFVARLHRFAENWTPSDGFERQFWNLEGLSGDNMGGGVELLPPEYRAVVEDTLDAASEVLDALGRERDVWGLIHSDLHHRNRLMSDGCLAAIDFDDCGFGYYLYDLAVILGFPRHKYRDEFEADLLPAFLEGYRAVRPLSDEHVALLPVFYALRHIVITLWVLGRAADNPYFADRAGPEVDSLISALTRADGPW